MREATVKRISSEVYIETAVEMKAIGHDVLYTTFGNTRIAVVDYEPSSHGEVDAAGKRGARGHVVVEVSNVSQNEIVEVKFFDAILDLDALVKDVVGRVSQLLQTV